MRGFHTSIVQLRSAHLRLAQKFASINEHLELLTMSVRPVWSLEKHNVSGHYDDIDPFGRLVVQQLQLLEECEKLISQIQALQGCEIFKDTIFRYSPLRCLTWTGHHYQSLQMAFGHHHSPS
jgi:hypothetical protein